MATLNPNVTEVYSTLYYKLCYESVTENETTDLILCISNGSSIHTHFRWNNSGEAILTVVVYTSSSYNDSDFLDCSMSKVYVASKSLVWTLV